MIQNKVYTNTILLSSLSQRCKTLNQLKQLHAYLLKSHIPQNPIAIGPLLSVAANSNYASFFSYARLIFQHLSFRNSFMYNTMIRGYVQTHLPIPAISCYVDMLSSGLVPNNYTFPPLIKACSILISYWKVIGCLVHAHVVKFGFSNDPFVASSLIEFYSLDLDIEKARMLFDEIPVRDVVLWTSMIVGYGKKGEVENARELFEEMPQRNVISWSAIIAVYSRASDFKEVLYLYRQMQETGSATNESVLVSVLTACAHLGALAQGLWVHSYAKRYNLDLNPILATALIDMYSKCGSVESALSVFEGIRIKDTAAWNAIISGAAVNGDARKSLELFNRMALSGTRPSEITFVAILTACTHGRLVREGLELFEQMGTLYQVEPQAEHYACVVDLMARAGMLKEAENFVEKKMGGLGGGDANVWGALLGACRTYGNVEIGNRVWRKLANMRITGFGTHVLSYNIYREAGWESETRGVRKLISQSGMKKTPGCSLIEVDGVVEEFVAGDLLHPRAQEIYKLLTSLFNTVYLEQ
ncbi:hypothetical protein LguiB_020067 [Lonicera macranthoides]